MFKCINNYIFMQHPNNPNAESSVDEKVGIIALHKLFFK